MVNIAGWDVRSGHNRRWILAAGAEASHQHLSFSLRFSFSLDPRRLSRIGSPAPRRAPDRSSLHVERRSIPFGSRVRGLDIPAHVPLSDDDHEGQVQ
jgi:hypothetical protein